MTTGQRLKEIRTKRKKTLEEVAEAIGSSATTISKYESDKVQNIPQKKLEAIAEYLDINPSYLLGYEAPEFGGAIVLNVSEQLLIEDYRKLSYADQQTIAILLQRLLEVADQNGQKPIQLTL